MSSQKVNKEVLDFFLDDDRMNDSIDTPDEGIDYIFMLDSDDWKRLENEWSKRSDNWKIAMIYLAGNVRFQLSRLILLRALVDLNSEIVVEGLLAIHQSITDEIDEMGKFDYTFLSEYKDLILTQLMRYGDFDECSEFIELRNIII